MKKDLIIEIEEECIECPMLSLETVTKEVRSICDGVPKGWVTVVDHKCKHLDFCKPVRHHWEEARKGYRPPMQ